MVWDVSVCQLCLDGKGGALSCVPQSTGSKEGVFYPHGIKGWGMGWIPEGGVQYLPYQGLVYLGSQGITEVCVPTIPKGGRGRVDAYVRGCKSVVQWL